MAHSSFPSPFSISPKCCHPKLASYFLSSTLMMRIASFAALSLLRSSMPSIFAAASIPISIISCLFRRSNASPSRCAAEFSIELRSPDLRSIVAASIARSSIFISLSLTRLITLATLSIMSGRSATCLNANSDVATIIMQDINCTQYLYLLQQSVIDGRRRATPRA